MPVNHEGIAHLLSWEGDVGRTVLERIQAFEDIARTNAPVRLDHDGEHLFETIGHAIQPSEPDKLVVLVGTHPDEDIRGYSWIVQTGSVAHEIRPRLPRQFLKFKVGGRTVYRRRVWHPGTTADPFLMRWIDVIVH